MVPPFLVASLTVAGVNDDILAAGKVHAAVVTTYLASSAQKPKLHH